MIAPTFPFNFNTNIECVHNSTLKDQQSQVLLSSFLACNSFKSMKYNSTLVWIYEMTAWLLHWKTLWPHKLNVLWCNQITYHDKTVSYPKTAPSNRAFWNCERLTVYSHYIRWGITHHTSTDVWLNISLSYRHHRHWGIGWQPVRLVIPASVIADIVGTTEQERHCAESAYTRTSPTCKTENI